MPKSKAASTLNITRPFLYKLLKEKDLICSPDNRNIEMKRIRSGGDAMVEEACVKWIREKRNQEFKISQLILIERAKMFAEEFAQKDWAPSRG